MKKDDFPSALYRQISDTLYEPTEATIGPWSSDLESWVGMSARTIIGEDGIGQTSTIAFDSHGSVGQSIHTLFVRPR